jgi:hypothetical protein
MAKLLYRFSHLHVRLEPDAAGNRTVLYLEGSATFIRLPQLAQVLESVPTATELHVHFEGLDYIDHACLELLMAWEKQHEAMGGSLVIDWESLTARFHGAPRRANGHGPAGVDEGPGPASCGSRGDFHSRVNWFWDCRDATTDGSAPPAGASSGRRSA